MIEHVRQTHLVSGDTRISKAEEDWLLGEKMVPVSAEQLIDWARRAAEVKAAFDTVATAGMTLQRALRIRSLRAASSWRVVAAITHAEWGDDAMWSPKSNQLAGLALCEAAAQKLGEDPARPPWQSVS